MVETWAVIAGVLGGIVLIGNAVNVISKLIKPALANQKMTEENAKRIAELEERSNLYLEEIRRLSEMNKLLVSSEIVILDHMIDGNHVEDMKNTRDYLIKTLSKL